MTKKEKLDGETDEHRREEGRGEREEWRVKRKKSDYAK